MNKIKVLHISQAAGGVDVYIRMLLKYLDKNEFENIIVCSQDFCEKKYDGLVSKFEQIDMKREIGLSDIRNIFQIRRLIKKYKPDIIYAHSSKAGAIGRIANIGCGSKCIYNPHGWSFNMRCSKSKQKMYVFIEKMAAIFCDKIVCISDAEKKSAESKHICKKDKLVTIYNGIDIELYENGCIKTITREELCIPTNSFVVGMVGRISYQKAPDVFIKAAKLIKKKISNAYFVIVGTGEQEQEIREYAKKNDLTNSLCITGWVDNPLSYIEIFDVACLLSRWEGFGLVIPEYMLCKKPIVANNVDAIPNLIVNYKNGLLVSVDDYEEVAEKILELYKSQELCEKLTYNGLQSVKNKFDAKRVSLEHSKMFKEILK